VPVEADLRGTGTRRLPHVASFGPDLFFRVRVHGIGVSGLSCHKRMEVSRIP
jgi:hypothetical protein